ncbi:major facilitator superfamily domain-containing protein 6-like isoform X2 [Argiope bruennichi]|uniref:major facilitator superfamily domain-containing protein 6-like isoform X2 n=1 Tax=Argiope bruennichi TaxID=94029 RepID=UPI002495A3BC|nr:major facilitator superfamily domain-containing protein 6-like isoform X2 [Argiope bruennichi]
MMAQENGKNGDIYIIPSKSATQKTAEIQKFWHIDREMLRFKLHFFLFIGALGTSLPYITIFAKNRIGITASSLAAILTTQQFLFIFTKPVIGYIADYFNKLKAVICILSIVQTIFFILLLTIPKIEKGEDQAVLDNNTYFFNSYIYLNSSQLYINCPSNGNSSFSESLPETANNEKIQLCFLSLDYLSNFSDECSNQDLKAMNISEILILNNNKSENSLFFKGKENGSLLTLLYFHFLPTCEICCKSTGMCHKVDCGTLKEKQKEDSSKKKFVSDFETYQFWIYAILTTFGMGCTNGLFTLSDTACCESVEKTGAEFGRQRLYGAIGWGLMSPVGGLLNDYTNDFTAAWILMTAMSLVSLLNILRLDLVKPKFSKNLLKDIGAVLKSKEFLAFKLCVLLNGIGTGVLWFYLVWYLTTIGGSRFLCGMVQFVQCFVGEIPFMFFSGWVIKKIGHFNVLTLALMSYCIRFFWYSHLSNPWLILPAEVLHGFTYGIFYTSVTSYAKLSAKPGTEATTQAVLFTAHEGLGAGIGCIVAGLGFDNLGGHTTFFYLSVFAGFGMVLSIILHFFIRRQKVDLVTPS